MLKALKKKMKDQRGLTLVELLAVIVILGIIAAIAVPSVGNIIQKSREDAVRSEAIQVLNAANLYLASVGEDEDNSISTTELDPFISDYSLDITTITISGGTIRLTGSGEAGDVDVNFYGATLSDLNDDAKWVKNAAGTEINVNVKPTT